MRKGLKAVLFDLDGTLVDTHFLIFRCLNESLEAAAGIKFEETWWHDNAGKPLHLLYPIALEANGRTDVSIDDLIVDYRKRLKSYEHEVRLFPGALEMIEEVERGGLQLALVTTKHSEAADRHLESVGLAGRFAVVMTGDQCKHYKPHPDPFERVLTKLSLEPAACISVGDSPGDIIASHGAGVPAVAAMWGCLHNDETLSAGPDYVISEPNELFSKVLNAE